MTYRDRDTLFGLSGPGLPIAAGDTPGGWPVGTRGIALGEPAKAERVNRLSAALAENDEFLHDITSTREIAATEVGAFTSIVPLASLVINPTGGGGVVSYNGTLYMGEAGWVDNQENRDTLFQLLDSNYNEVIVDGVEVKISAVAGSAIGGGFVTATTTLTLNKTIPVGQYRLAYGRGRTYETLPAYALIRADIRGLHEAPGEAQKQAFYVLDAAASKPSDFHGASALVDALAALSGPYTLFLRPGTYTAPASIIEDNITIIGDGSSSSGAVIEMPVGQDIVISADGVRIQNVYVSKAAVEDRRVRVTGSRCSMYDVQVATAYLRVEGTYGEYRKMTLGGYGRALYLTGNAVHNIFDDIFMNPGLTVTTDPVFDVDAGGASFVEYCEFRNVRTGSSLTAAAQVALHLYRARYCSFQNMEINSYNAYAISLGEVLVGLIIQSSKFRSRRACAKTDTTALPNSINVHFIGVDFVNVGTGDYNGTFVDLETQESDVMSQRGIIFDGVTITDPYCTCTDGAGAGLPMVRLVGVNGRNLGVYNNGRVTNNEDGPVLYLKECVLEDVEVWVPSAQASVAVVSAGIVEVRERCNIRRIKIVGCNGEHQRPALYMKGASSPPSTAWNEESYTIVDGFEILNTGVTEFFIDPTNVAATSKAICAHLDGFAKLRRFGWGQNNVAGKTTGSNIRPHALIQLNDRYSEVREAIVYHATTVGLVRRILFIPEDVSYCKICDNVMSLSDPRNALSNMDNAIYVDDASSAARAHEIRGNTIFWYGNGSVPVNLKQCVVYIGSDVYFAKFSDNHIHVDDLSAGADVVHFADAGTYPPGAGGAPGGGGVATGNTIINNDSSALNTAPTISAPGGALTGIATNVLGAI